MSMTDKFEYDQLRSMFCGFAITNVSASGGTTLVWYSLHTADPTDAGSTGAEGGYTAYTRMAVDRSTVGHTVTSAAGAGAATVTPTTALTFPVSLTTSTGTFTHFMAWPTSNATVTSGMWVGTITPNINFGLGVAPVLTTGSSITLD